MLGWRSSVPAEDPLLMLLLDEAAADPPDEYSDAAKTELIDDPGRPFAGLSIPISFSDCNIRAIVEVTQRARERREREASAPPVYDFGSHSCWSGDE
jgi:hypothetical protein